MNWIFLDIRSKQDTHNVVLASATLYNRIKELLTPEDNISCPEHVLDIYKSTLLPVTNKDGDEIHAVIMDKDPFKNINTTIDYDRK